MIYIVRKSTPRFTRFISLVLIRLFLIEIQRFKSVKINKEMYGIRTLCRTASGWPTGSPSSKYVLYATACAYRELHEKIADRKKIV